MEEAAALQKNITVPEFAKEHLWKSAMLLGNGIWDATLKNVQGYVWPKKDTAYQLENITASHWCNMVDRAS